MCIYIDYTRNGGKRKPLSRALRRIWTNGQPSPIPRRFPVQNAKEPLRIPRSGSALFVYFWKVTPDTVTLTPATSRPLVFITAF